MAVNILKILSQYKMMVVRSGCNAVHANISGKLWLVSDIAHSFSIATVLQFYGLWPTYGYIKRETIDRKVLTLPLGFFYEIREW